VLFLLRGDLGFGGREGKGRVMEWDRMDGWMERGIGHIT
jgi:hypothetical protein